MSTFTTLRDKIEALLHSEATNVETFFRGVFAELSPMLESDLKAAAEAGAAAAISTVASGATVMSVSAIEAALIAGARAAVDNAKLNGKSLAIQTGVALMGAAGLEIPELSAEKK